MLSKNMKIYILEINLGKLFPNLALRLRNLCRVARNLPPDRLSSISPTWPGDLTAGSYQ